MCLKLLLNGFQVLKINNLILHLFKFSHRIKLQELPSKFIDEGSVSIISNGIRVVEFKLKKDAVCIYDSPTQYLLCLKGKYFNGKYTSYHLPMVQGFLVDIDNCTKLHKLEGSIITFYFIPTKLLKV